ncbi:mechanosensitive ion channel family protein [Aquibacillus sediminis]|uniref:mechanosensitive ion channel family protein n=1 Tax=Aquibacillus sediminis TaxID=2574734 RepID=UPI0011096DBF|nr:mechanosensitive ion channel family protein [Aquibacillus sediminis]
MEQILVHSIAKIILALVLTLFIVRISRKLISKFFQKTDFFRDKKEQTIESVLYSIIKYSATFGYLFYVLRVFDVEVGKILAGAGVLGIIVGFGAQHLIKDFLAGVFLIYEKQAHKGDWVRVNETFEGTVEEIGFRFLKIREWSGVLLTISHGQLQTMENFNIDKMRVIEHITVSFQEHPAHVLAVLDEICQKLNQELVDYLKKDDNGNPVEAFQVYGLSSLNNQFNGYQYTITGLCDDNLYFTAAKQARQMIATGMFEHQISMAEQRVYLK